MSKCYDCGKKRAGSYVGQVFICNKCQKDIPSMAEQREDYQESCARQGINFSENEFQKN